MASRSRHASYAFELALAMVHAARPNACIRQTGFPVWQGPDTLALANEFWSDCMRTLWVTPAVILVIASGVASAQPPAPAPPPFDFAKMRADMEAYDKMPDTAGTGRYPALKEMDASLPNHVVYRPKDLSQLGKQKLGVLAWGNGGCSADGAGARLHLAEIASHGYLVIASGTILSGPGAPPRAPGSMPGPPPAPVAGAPPSIPPPATKTSSLREAIDWALAENIRAGSPYFGRIDPRWIAVSGWSCGGLQALEIAADPRVRTVIIHNSGIFSPGANPIPGMSFSKTMLQKLHTPIIYILGGPTDIAYANGMDDFKQINGIPVVVANLDVGHAGTFLQPNGGRATSVAVSWLDWQLKGDIQAAKRFTGPDCGLCQDPDWKVERKNMDGAH
jgi:dienelactone hydrolase